MHVNAKAEDCVLQERRQLQQVWQRQDEEAIAADASQRLHQQELTLEMQTLNKSPPPLPSKLPPTTQKPDVGKTLAAI